MSQNRYQGVATMDDIKDRCYVDDVTGHWHWRAAMTSWSRERRAPYVWYPPIQKSISVARVICHIKTGAPPPKGKISYRACGCWDCVNPDHYKVGTRSEMGKRTRPHNTPLHNAKISAAMLAKLGSKRQPHVPGNSVFNFGG